MTSSDRSLREVTRFGTAQDVYATLLSMAEHFSKVCAWITENQNRTEKSLILFNLISSSAAYLHVAAANLQNHGSVIALCTRSLYELNLRIRYVLSSDQNMQAWQAEAAVDKIQALEGILQLDTVSDNATQKTVVNAEIIRLKGLLIKHNLQNVRNIPTTKNIADTVGQTNEYKALFKLFSKLVHPSSYLVNSYTDAMSPEIISVLQIHLQLYAWDLFCRACDALSVPENIREMKFEEIPGAS